MNKKYYCPNCSRIYTDINSLCDHVGSTHPEVVPKTVSIKQYIFNVRNKLPPNNKFGKSILSGKPTTFNEELGKYNRLANEKEKEEYRKMFVTRMKKVHGKEHLLNDVEQQIKMLHSRKISGKFKMFDDKEIPYTGSYERDFLESLNRIEWPSEDIMMPAPQIFNYKDEEGKDHFYIPDAFLVSLNLIVEIKSADNKHYRLRDINVERIKDKILKESSFNYVKIYDMDYSAFLEKIIEIRDECFVKI